MSFALSFARNWPQCPSMWRRRNERLGKSPLRNIPVEENHVCVNVCCLRYREAPLPVWHLRHSATKRRHVYGVNTTNTRAANAIPISTLETLMFSFIKVNFAGANNCSNAFLLRRGFNHGRWNDFELLQNLQWFVFNLTCLRLAYHISNDHF